MALVSSQTTCKENKSCVLVLDQSVAGVISSHETVVGDVEKELNEESLGLTEDEESLTAAGGSFAAAAASVGLSCEWCEESFKDMNSSTLHLRVKHPDHFYPVDTETLDLPAIVVAYTDLPVEKPDSTVAVSGNDVKVAGDTAADCVGYSGFSIYGEYFTI